MYKRTKMQYLDEHEIIWEVPSKTVSQMAQEQKERWFRIAAALKEHPNEWAVIGIRDDGGAVNAATALQFLGDDFEFATRKRDGISRLYARYRTDEEV